MTRSLPIVFGQQDYFQQLGTTGGSIKEYGCKLTTHAIIAKACGKETDPIELNKLYISKGFYSDGKNLTDDALTKVYPDIILQQSIDYSNSPADLNLIKELLKDQTNWVVLRIKIPPPFNTHFVLCTGVNGVVTIANPLTKKQEDFSQLYGDPVTNITKVTVYKGTPSVIEDQAVRNEANINWNCFLEVTSHLGLQADPSNKIGTVIKVKEKIDSYISQIASYTKALEDLKKSNEESQRLVLSLKNEMSEIHKQDASFGEEAYDAQHKVNELQEGLQKIGKTMELQYDPTNDKKLIDEILSEIAHKNKIIEDTNNNEAQILKNIVTLFISMGINNYLPKVNKPQIDAEDINDETYKSIFLYLEQLTKEFLSLTTPQEPVITDKPFKEEVNKVKDNLVKKVINYFLLKFFYAE